MKKRCQTTREVGFKWLSLTLGIFCASGLWAQTAELPITEVDQTISAALSTTGAPSASVAVVRAGQIAYAKAFGKADVEKDRLAGTKTRYAVGSISKQFTVAALLLAQEEGKVSLDDKVSKYYPDLTRANEITFANYCRTPLVMRTTHRTIT
jgi:D-alanyl-D-alanine carboxypeptidase